MVLQLFGVDGGSVTLTRIHEHPSGATISFKVQVTSHGRQPHWVLSNRDPEGHEGEMQGVQSQRSAVGKNPAEHGAGGSQISEQELVAHGVQHSVGERYWPWGQEVGQGAHLQPTVS